MRQNSGEKARTTRGYYRGMERSQGVSALDRKRKRKRVSVKRACTFIGLAALGVGVATLVKMPLQQGFEEQVLEMHEHIEDADREDIMGYETGLGDMLEAGYARLSVDYQVHALDGFIASTHPDARDGAALTMYLTLDSDARSELLQREFMYLGENEAQSFISYALGDMALAERVEFTDEMLSSLPEHARRELLTEHSSDVLDGLYHGAVGSTKERITNFLSGWFDEGSE